jgi:hypothetical protein
LRTHVAPHHLLLHGRGLLLPLRVLQGGQLPMEVVGCRSLLCILQPGQRVGVGLRMSLCLHLRMGSRGLGQKVLPDYRLSQSTTEPKIINKNHNPNPRTHYLCLGSCIDVALLLQRLSSLLNVNGLLKLMHALLPRIHASANPAQRHAIGLLHECALAGGV